MISPTKNTKTRNHIISHFFLSKRSARGVFSTQYTLSYTIFIYCSKSHPAYVIIKLLRLLGGKMRFKKHYSHKIFICIYLFLFAIFGYFGMQPHNVEANSNLILEAPKISLKSAIKVLQLNNDYTLTAPDQIAGLYYAAENNTFIIGHSSTIFGSLHNLKLNDQIKLDNHTYKITNLYIQAKDSISMSKVLEPKATPTLTLMTCYGEKIAENDYTERLILTAELEK